MAPMWLSVAFIILTVISFSLGTVIFKKAAFYSQLPDAQKMDLIRKAGLFGRIWILLIAVLGLTDFFQDFSSLPPRVLLAVVPMILALIWLARTKLIPKLFPSLSILSVYFLQVFRVAVEIGLLNLWKAHLVPQSMTFEGRNFDILIGATTPIVGLLVYKQKLLSEKWAFYWNILGILVLTNVVVTGLLSTPTPLRLFFEDYPNIAIGIFPFVWLPTVLVPLAYGLHILAIRYYFWSKNLKSQESHH